MSRTTTLPETQAMLTPPTPPIILLVDDEADLLAALRSSLRRYPLRVLTAGSAAQALALLGEEPVDLIVSDERMPGVSGTELLAVVRQQYPQVVRIMLSGHVSVATALRAINDGEVYRLLTKPCHPADLAQTILNALQTRDLARHSTRLLAMVRRQESGLRGTLGDTPAGRPLSAVDADGILLETAEIGRAHV